MKSKGQDVNPSFYSVLNGNRAYLSCRRSVANTPKHRGRGKGVKSVVVDYLFKD